MRFIFDNGGQTCNKLWGYIAPLLYAERTKECIVVSFYDREIDLFPNLLNYKHFKYPFYSKFWHGKLGTEKYVNACRRVFGKLFSFGIKHWPEHFVETWNFRNVEITRENRELIESVFKPCESIVSNVSSLFNVKREKYDIIIGVHIRQGDYKSWRRGLYYYPFERYASFCRKLIEKFNDKRVLFFISTNAKIEDECFKNIDFFSVQSDNAVSDLYGLSLCDYIIGPPSSFSRWASFYGKVPICWLMDASQVTFNFKTLSSYDKYIDGSAIEFDF